MMKVLFEVRLGFATFDGQSTKRKRCVQGTGSKRKKSGRGKRREACRERGSLGREVNHYKWIFKTIVLWFWNAMHLQGGRLHGSY